jgi:hypothetical protein
MVELFTTDGMSIETQRRATSPENTTEANTNRVSGFNQVE